MLVLTVREDDEVFLNNTRTGEQMAVLMLSVSPTRCRVGFEFPPHYSILRGGLKDDNAADMPKMAARQRLRDYVMDHILKMDVEDVANRLGLPETGGSEGRVVRDALHELRHLQ